MYGAEPFLRIMLLHFQISAVYLYSKKIRTLKEKYLVMVLAFIA
jgi:hypothetical protein